jgi:hypothetical protein
VTPSLQLLLVGSKRALTLSQRPRSRRNCRWVVVPRAIHPRADCRGFHFFSCIRNQNLFSCFAGEPSLVMLLRQNHRHPRLNLPHQVVRLPCDGRAGVHPFIFCWISPAFPQPRKNERTIVLHLDRAFFESPPVRRRCTDRLNMSVDGFVRVQRPLVGICVEADREYFLSRSDVPTNREVALARDLN